MRDRFHHIAQVLQARRQERNKRLYGITPPVNRQAIACNTAIVEQRQALRAMHQALCYLDYISMFDEKGTPYGSIKDANIIEASAFIQCVPSRLKDDQVASVYAEIKQAMGTSAALSTNDLRQADQEALKVLSGIKRIFIKAGKK